MDGRGCLASHAAVPAISQGAPGGPMVRARRAEGVDAAGSRPLAESELWIGDSVLG